MINFKQDLKTVDETNVCLNDADVETIPNIVARQLQIETQAGKEFIRIALANALLMDRKQKDYGPRNISGFGLFGVVVRMNDKHERLKTLIAKGRKRKAQNESIQDTLRDIANYAVIALIMDEGRWPNE